nr:prenylated Rab acceptor protein 1 isoform X1 [Danaus plexippus plexippus]
MADNVNIDIPGEINATMEKKGFQKLLQQVRSGAGPALVLGVLSSRRPWSQFVATDNFKAPVSLPRLSRRFYKNVEYFQANYLIVFLGLFAYCLITSPLLLIAMVASFFGYRKLTSGPNTWKVILNNYIVFLLHLSYLKRKLNWYFKKIYIFIFSHE